MHQHHPSNRRARRAGPEAGSARICPNPHHLGLWLNSLVRLFELRSNLQPRISSMRSYSSQNSLGGRRLLGNTGWGRGGVSCPVFSLVWPATSLPVSPLLAFFSEGCKGGTAQTAVRHYKRTTMNMHKCTHACVHTECAQHAVWVHMRHASVCAHMYGSHTCARGKQTHSPSLCSFPGSHVASRSLNTAQGKALFFNMIENEVL